jgi:hypothetical protein
MAIPRAAHELAQALVDNIRIGCRALPGTNTLA